MKYKTLEEQVFLNTENFILKLWHSLEADMKRLKSRPQLPKLNKFLTSWNIYMYIPLKMQIAKGKNLTTDSTKIITFSKSWKLLQNDYKWPIP